MNSQTTSFDRPLPASTAQLQDWAFRHQESIRQVLPSAMMIPQPVGFGNFTNNDSWGNFGNHDTTFSRANAMPERTSPPG